MRVSERISLLRRQRAEANLGKADPESKLG